MFTRLASLGRALAPFTLMAGVGVLLFVRPALFFGLVSSVIAMGFAIASLVGLLIAVVLMAPKTMGKLGVRAHTAPPQAFVGVQGVRSRLRILDQPGQLLRVEWSRGNYFTVISALLICGPGVTLAFALKPHLLPGDLPWLMALAVGGISVVASLLLVKYVRDYAFRRPSLVVTSAEIRLMMGPRISKAISRSIIDGLRIDPHTYTYSDEGTKHTHPNFILVACLADGIEEPLCICDREAQLVHVIGAIRTRLRLGPDRSPDRRT